MVVVLSLLLLFAYSLSKEKLFYLMGTYALIELPEGKEYEAYRLLRGLEEKLSDYIETSEVSKINALAGKGCLEVSEDTLRVVEESLRAAELTGGSFDPTVGSYTINYLRKRLIKEEEAKSLIDYRKVKIAGNKVCLEEKNMALDLGGVGKGYAVQRAYEELKTPWGFISIAGDLRVWGHSRLLAVYNPMNNSLLAEGYNSKDLCLSTGGNYLRKHIIGRENSLLQATVAYEDCTIADAVETALLAMDDQSRERFIQEHPHIGVLLLFKDGSIYMNASFRERFKELKLY